MSAWRWRELRIHWLEGITTVGITAGASAPERLVDGVLEWLDQHALVVGVEEMKGKEERISFKPAVLADEASPPPAR